MTSEYFISMILKEEINPWRVFFYFQWGLVMLICNVDTTTTTDNNNNNSSWLVYGV